MADTPIKDAVKRMCDKIFRASQYAETFEVVDDDFTYPHVTYFNEKGDALQINHLTKFITFFPEAGLRPPRTVPLQDIRDLLYALEGAAFSILAMDYEDFKQSGAFADGVPLWAGLAHIEIEGGNLFELFTNLLARHQDEGTREHFQAELKKFESKE